VRRVFRCDFDSGHGFQVEPAGVRCRAFSLRLKANSFSHWFYPLDHQIRLQRALQLFPGKGELLEQPEDFEDDHDNDNHSNYVKDVSAHVGNSYQIARAMINIYLNLSAIHRKFA
jgi:hypothetical protein